MIFTEPLYPHEACTCCRDVGAASLDRTYRRCRACYETCPAIGGCRVIRGEDGR